MPDVAAKMLRDRAKVSQDQCGPIGIWHRGKGARELFKQRKVQPFRSQLGAFQSVAQCSGGGRGGVCRAGVDVLTHSAQAVNDRAAPFPRCFVVLFPRGVG